MEDTTTTSQDKPSPATTDTSELKAKQEGGVANGCGETDTELDALLDASLNEFGKHVPPSNDTRDESPPPKEKGGGGGALGWGRSISRVDDEDDPTLCELEKVFGEEFAAQAEAEMNEALKLLSSENPELLKEFESLASTLGLKDESTQEGAEPTSTTPPHTKGSLEAILEETVRNIHKGGVQKESIGEMPSKLAEMMNNLTLDTSPGNDADIMNAMEGMMNTLLSKDVLYPSLVEFCSQYPEWLRTHEDSLSPEDKSRYTKQLDIMRTICHEFEGAGQGVESERQERIMQLMQQLQECGQPPDDLGGGPIPTPLLSPSTDLPTTPNDQCSVM